MRPASEATRRSLRASRRDRRAASLHADLEYLDRRPAAAERHLPEGADRRIGAESIECGVGDDDLARLGDRGFQTGRGVDDVTEDGVLAAPRRADVADARRPRTR